MPQQIVQLVYPALVLFFVLFTLYAVIEYKSINVAIIPAQNIIFFLFITTIKNTSYKIYMKCFLMLFFLLIIFFSSIYSIRTSHCCF